MTFTHKLARRLAILRALPPHCAMGPALALIVACSAGVPTGIDTGNALDNAPLVVNPRSLILEANQVSVFKAYASGVPGDSLVTSIEWTATGGSIGLDGTYSSPSTGDYKVVGKRHGPKRTTSDTAKVTVVPPQPSITGVVVSPGSANVTTGTQQTFGATGRLSDGSTVAIGVTLTAGGGTIDAGGVYTAGTAAGTYRVIAKAASANVADTVPVTVTSAPPPAAPPPGGLYPNLPSGLTPLFQYDGNGLTPQQTYGTTNMALGVGNIYGAPAASFPSDGSAPVDPPTVLDVAFTPTNTWSNPGSASPLQQYMWKVAFGNAVSEYYEAGWFKIVGTDFEMPSAGMAKFWGYWAVGTPLGGNAFTVYNTLTTNSSAGSTAAGQLATSWSVQIRGQGPVSWAQYANINNFIVLANHWVRYEIHMVLENPQGSNTGKLQLWCTDVTAGGSPIKVIDVSNLPYRSATGDPTGFWLRAFSPVWGGQALVQKTRDDHVRWARMAGFGR